MLRTLGAAGGLLLDTVGGAERRAVLQHGPCWRTARRSAPPTVLRRRPPAAPRVLSMQRSSGTGRLRTFLFAGLATGLAAGLLAGVPLRVRHALDPAPTLGRVTAVPAPGQRRAARERRLRRWCDVRRRHLNRSAGGRPRLGPLAWRSRRWHCRLDRQVRNRARRRRAGCACPWGAVVLGQMEYSAPSFFAAGYWLRRYNPDGALVWSRVATTGLTGSVTSSSSGTTISIAGTDGHYYSKPLVQRASFVTGELGDHDLTEYSADRRPAVAY